MERKYRLTTVMLTLLLTGCGGTEGDAIKVVKETLKDPDSAKFGEFTEINDRLACLTVNAKNGFGGYIGERQALLRRVDGEWSMASMVDTPHETCVANWPQFERELSADDLLEKACEEQRQAGSKYSAPSAVMCLYGKSLDAKRKLEFVDAWDRLKGSIAKMDALGKDEDDEE